MAISCLVIKLVSCICFLFSNIVSNDHTAGECILLLSVAVLLLEILVLLCSVTKLFRHIKV